MSTPHTVLPHPPKLAGTTVYFPHVNHELARMLSMMDREALSITYGCFDRTFWGWKFTDFPGARFQEGIYALSHLWHASFPGNALSQDERVLAWIRAAINFWQRLQHRDGSFDEAYPFEHSLAATAFSTFYVGEAYHRVVDAFSTDEQKSLRQTFVRAGDWLCHNDEYHGILSNHLAAAAAALEVLFQITGEDRFKLRSRHFLQRIYDHQSNEGWYEEYGGADPGYQTHCMFYLARLWVLTKDVVLLESLKRAIEFLKYFIHPNGTLGGEYASRNTEFYFPAGIEMLAEILPDAANIASFMRPSVSSQRAAGLPAMDPYNFFPLLNNYLFASEIALQPARGTLPCEARGEWTFPDAGLFVRSTDAYYVVAGLSKGGVVKLYDRATRRLMMSDCGYWGRLTNGAAISSQSLDRTITWSAEANSIRAQVPFVQIKQRVSSPFLFVAFRLFSVTVGRIQAAAYWLKNQLVRLLIRRGSAAPLKLTRRLSFTDDSFTIEDELELESSQRIQTLRRDAKFSTIHMGSSRYFQIQELEPDSLDQSDFAEALMRERLVRITNSWKATEGRTVEAEAGHTVRPAP